MARRVVSLLHRGPAALRASDPVIEAHAYALAVDVDLVLVLVGEGVELAVEGEAEPRTLAGVALPASAGGRDLRGLVESGVGVYVSAAGLTECGLAADALISGVRVADESQLDALVGQADAVLNW